MSASVSREPMSNIRLRPPGLGPCQSVSCSRFERQAVPSMSDTPRRYGLDDLKGDVFGGVVSAVMMVPVALGFGVLSGLGTGGRLLRRDRRGVLHRGAPRRGADDLRAQRDRDHLHGGHHRHLRRRPGRGVHDRDAGRPAADRLRGPAPRPVRELAARLRGPRGVRGSGLLHLHEPDAVVPGRAGRARHRNGRHHRVLAAGGGEPERGRAGRGAHHPGRVHRVAAQAAPGGSQRARGADRRHACGRAVVRRRSPYRRAADRFSLPCTRRCSLPPSCWMPSSRP